MTAPAGTVFVSTSAIESVFNGAMEALMKWRWLTTIEDRNMARQRAKTNASHPGEILRVEFMEPMGITAYRLAKELLFPGIYEVVREERGISADLALRLGKYFGMTPQFWMNLQSEYDLRLARANVRLERIKPRSAA